MTTKCPLDAARALGCEVTTNPKRRRTTVQRYLSAVGLAILSATASAATYTLIVGPRVELGPVQGVPSNLIYTPVSGSIGDLNADGAADVVIGMNGAPPVVYFNNRTADPFQNVSGAFVAPPPGPNMPGISWGAAVLADANADGRLDLAIAGFNAPNMIYLNDGTSSPFSSGSGVAIGTQDVGWVPAFGDVNGDGFNDMAVANTNHVPSRLYLTQGAPLTSGTYVTVQVGTDVGYGQDTKIVDVNGDARPDLILSYTIANAVGADPEGIAIYINDGTADPFGNVTPLRLLPGYSVSAIALADLNGDGETDLVASASDSSFTIPTLDVFLNTGALSQPFSNPQPLEPDTNVGGLCAGVTVGDVNGDARPDLLFSCAAPSQDTVPPPENPAVGAIYLNSGTANPFADVAPVDIPAAAQSGYGRTVAVGALVANGAPHVLVVDDDHGGYYPTAFAQDPVAQADSAVVAIDKSIQIAVLANDTAAPGQSLNVSSVTITAAPQHGTANVNSANGSVTYQPTVGYTGTDHFEYTVGDGLGARSQAATVNVSVQPAPVATNDSSTIGQGQSVTLDVLANDTSAGGTLDAASLSIAVAPQHGTAAISNGQIIYTPASGYSGVDGFQYSVRDNLGTESNSATVSLSVQPGTSGGGGGGGGGGGATGLLELLAIAGLLVQSSSAQRRRRNLHTRDPAR